MKYKRMATACVAVGLAAGVAACSSGGNSSTSSSAPASSAPASSAPASSAPASSAPASSATGSAATGTPIVIGSVGTYTQGTGGFTDPGGPAIQAWASWVNAHGGINGHPVQLIVKDNKGDQAQAVSLVKQLVEQDHVVAFVSNQDGSLNAGYASYLEQQKIPVLGGNVYTPDPWVSNPMFFPEGPDHCGPGHRVAGAERQDARPDDDRLDGVLGGPAVCLGQRPDEGCAFGAGFGDHRCLRRPCQHDRDRLHVKLPRRRTEAREGARPVRTHRFRGTGDRGRLPAAELQPGLRHPRRGDRRQAYLQSSAFNNAFASALSLPWFSTAPAIADFDARR